MRQKLHRHQRLQQRADLFRRIGADRRGAFDHDASIAHAVGDRIVAQHLIRAAGGNDQADDERPAQRQIDFRTKLHEEVLT